MSRELAHVGRTSHYSHRKTPNHRRRSTTTHGLIVNQLRGYVVSRFGRTGWTRVLAASNAELPEGPLPMSMVYDDTLVISMVVAAADVAKTDVQLVLGDFGRYLADGLLRVYGPLVESNWRTLDVIEHAERQIHTVVRMRDSNAGPPYLTAVRRSPMTVDVVYSSERHLCSLADGIVHGIAEHYGERVTVTQTECMLRGDARCLIRVQLQNDNGLPEQN